MGQSKKQTTSRMDEEIWTPEQAAVYLKVSTKTIIRRIKDKTIPGKRIGMKWRIVRTELDKSLLAG